MNTQSLLRFVFPLFLLLPIHTIQAEELYGDNFLFGDWGGSRTNMADDGIEFEFVITTDLYSLDFFDGDAGERVKKDIDLSNTDITMTIDGERAFDIEGATFFVYLLGDNGTNPSEQYVGDAQTFTNIESPDAFKLHEIWYQQNYSDDTLSILFGLYDLNSEFDVIESGGLFSGSSHGIGPDFSQAEGGPSIFPTVALTLRALFNFTDQAYIQAAIIDGVPGDPKADDNRTAIILDATDGFLTVVEVGHISADDAPFHKLNLGFWSYTKATVGNIESGNNIKNSGLYTSVDWTLLQENDDSGQGMTGFFRYGFAEEVINEIKTYTGYGFVYTGLIPGRDEDQFGIASATVTPTDAFRAGNTTAAPETAIEITYHAQLTPWFAIKPNYQMIKNPGMSSGGEDATVIGIRLELGL